jgi:hypothetical protein
MRQRVKLSDRDRQLSEDHSQPKDDRPKNPAGHFGVKLFSFSMASLSSSGILCSMAASLSA